MNHLQKKTHKFWLFVSLYLFFLFLSLVGIVYLNFFLKVKTVSIVFFDNAPENHELQNSIEGLIRREGSSFYNFLTLDEKIITKIIRDDFQDVSKIKISKKPNLDITVTVTKNDKYFYTCVKEDLGFLVPCMLGNSSGEYYKEIATGTEEAIKIDINNKVLFDADTQNPIDSPDSLSGNRIYTSDDFRKLLEFIKWVQKNGFVVKKVYVDELKIVSIFTDFYEIKISLDKGFPETIKDFAIISRTGNLQKYINEDKEKIKYIDLSYKGKVFYSLHGTNVSTTTLETSTTSTTTYIIH